MKRLPPVTRVKKCEGCEDPYISSHNAQKFCSDACGQLYYKYDGYAPKRSGRKCLGCCGDIPISAKLGRIYCGPKCWPSYPAGKNLKGLQDLGCWICADLFTAKRGNAQACSPACNTIKKQYRSKGISLEVPDREFACESCSGFCDKSRWLIDGSVVCLACATEAYESRLVRPRHRTREIGETRFHRGYVFEKVGTSREAHHRADKGGWVPQHILVAEEKFGIPITRAFTVHHRNRNPSDNRPENLDLRVGNHGFGGDVADTLLASPEMRNQIIQALERYGYQVSIFESDCA